VSGRNPDSKIITSAAKALRAGGLVAFPTETVYGLAANLLDKGAISELHRVKDRPKGKPFTVHIADTAIIRKMGCPVTKEAKILIDKFWPGPLTVILRSKSGEKIGFRMPDNKVALELIKKSKVPVVAPSANISGRKPPTSAPEVLADLNGKIDVVIDSGRTGLGIESTVVDLTQSPPVILREGAIKKHQIFRLLKIKI